MFYGKFIEWLHKHSIDIISECAGTLDGTTKCYAVIVEKLTDEQKVKLNKLKKVIKIGVAQYRYAPEITYPVIYYKGGEQIG